MRADAERNRRRLLDAAAEEILETGADPALDAIAKRADVGIATLYRHFADRQALLHAVARHVLTRTIEAGEAALTDSSDGATALRRYFHLAVDNRIGIVNLIHHHIEQPDWPDIRTRAESLLRAIVDRARADKAVPAELAPADVALAVIRFSRPTGTGLPPDEERALAHAQIDTFIDGLASAAAN